MRKKKNVPVADKQQNQQIGERRGKRWLLFAGFAIAAAAAGVLAFLPRPQAGAVDTDRLSDDPALGPISAPVTIVEYGDFGCSACKAWFRAGILEKLRSQYGDKIRFVYRDFPVITPQSPKAAEAAQCAHDQGKFWEYHDLLFKSSDIGVSQLKTYAGEVGLDAAKFSQCLDSGRHGPTVERDLRDAIERGFRGTPAFLVNDTPLTLGGAPTFAYFQRLIDQILSLGG